MNEGWICGEHLGAGLAYYGLNYLKLWEYEWIICVNKYNHTDNHIWDIVCEDERDSLDNDDNICLKEAAEEYDYVMIQFCNLNDYANREFIYQLAKLATWIDFGKLEGNDVVKR